ncbi:MAG: Fic family protein [Rickettsiales bacterium]|jgi:fido (protein-threonine AMPylation protein)|nr:Fic family protein [Rickettsiales bacterium]
MSNFGEYEKIGEPSAQQRIENWQAAIGLQQVDGLTPSKYLVEIAKKNIDGKISADEVVEEIRTYYKKNPPKTDIEKGKKEADEVSSRINKLLSKPSFSFSPVELITIHKYLFTGILSPKIAGHIRDYDIKKEEPILNGKSVDYGRADSINETLDYDFRQEKSFKYAGLSKCEKVEHITKFMSGIWQIHPFGEGNTRTTTIFIIKYLQAQGFKIDHKLFVDNTKYFRNALVRANYQNLECNIEYNYDFLNSFFDNLLLSGENVLDSKLLYIDATTQKTTQKILEVLTQNPMVTRTELAQIIGLTTDGVKWNLDKLKKENRIRRIGSDKGGHWEIIIGGNK